MPGTKSHIISKKTMTPQIFIRNYSKEQGPLGVLGGAMASLHRDLQWLCPHRAIAMNYSSNIMLNNSRSQVCDGYKGSRVKLSMSIVVFNHLLAQPTRNDVWSVQVKVYMKSALWALPFRFKFKTIIFVYASFTFSYPTLRIWTRVNHLHLVCLIMNPMKITSLSP